MVSEPEVKKRSKSEDSKHEGKKTADDLGTKTTSPAKQFSPTRPTGKFKRPDYTNKVVATKYYDSLAIDDICKANGDISYKADIKDAKLLY